LIGYIFLLNRTQLSFQNKKYLAGARYNRLTKVRCENKTIHFVEKRSFIGVTIKASLENANPQYPPPVLRKGWDF